MTSTTRPAPAPRRRPRRAGALDRLVARGLAALERPEAPYLVLLGFFCAGGTVLRLDRLGAQGLWFDEADMVTLARQPFGVLLRNLGAAGQNGPLYTLFLHVWMGIFGIGEAAVRLPSALAGAAAIPLIYALGRAIHGPKLGLYAAGILALSPYQHWYAQEAKMYAIIVLTTIASALALVRADRLDRPRPWLAYVAVTTLALYLHVLTALVIVAQACWLVAKSWVVSRESRVGRRTKQIATSGDGAATLPAEDYRSSVAEAPLTTHDSRPTTPPYRWLALAALTLPYLPIALWELRFVRGGAVTWHRPIEPLPYLRDLLVKYATGVRADEGTALRGALLFGALATLGALPLAWRHRPWAAPALAPRPRAGLLLCGALVPVVLFYALSLVRPLYADRYLIIATPALILLAAGGLLLLERRAWPLASVAIALILATSWVPLRDVNLAVAAQKEDWRGAYAEIAAHRHPNDAIIVHPGYVDTTLDYYAQRDSRLADIPVLTIPAEYFDGTRNEGALDLYLQRLTAGYERVWLILSPDRLAMIDPFDRRGDCRADRVRNWYCYNAHQIYAREFNGVWLGLYAYSRPFGAAFYPPPPIRLDRALGEALTLVGYGYDLAPGVSALRPGDSVPLVLHWTIRPPARGWFKMRWRLLDANGQPVAGVGATEPLLGGFVPRAWEYERRNAFWDYHDLALPQNLAAGQYRLAIEVVSTDNLDVPLGPGTMVLGAFAVAK
jgi:mannosyltransferase